MLTLPRRHVEEEVESMNVHRMADLVHTFQKRVRAIYASREEGHGTSIKRLGRHGVAQTGIILNLRIPAVEYFLQ